MPIRQLLYISRAAPSVDASDVAQIAALSRRDNYRRDVTGCLLYTGSAFAQVLEGRPDDVEALALKLRRDPRHFDFRVVRDTTVQLRAYSNWSMGCVLRPDLADEVQAILDDDTGTRSPTDVDRLLAEMRTDTVFGEL